MKVASKYFNFSILITIFLIIFSIGCKEKKVENSDGVFTFIKGEVSVNDQAVKAGARAIAGDIINVGDKSGAVLQFANHAHLTLSSNTQVFVIDLLKGIDGKPTINLEQHKGSTFSRVVYKGTNYKLGTPALVAGVRGTSFSVTIQPENKNHTSIKLLDGKLEALYVTTDETKSSEPVVLNAGEKISANNDNIEPKGVLTEEETAELKKLDSITMAKTDAVEKESISLDQEIQDVLISPKSLGPVPTEIKSSDKAQVKKAMTIDDLRKKYPNLSKVVTKDGKIYIGSFSQQGSNMQVITTTGVVSIPAEKVKSVSKY